VYARDKAPLQKVAEYRGLYKATVEKLEKLEKTEEGKDLINKFKKALAEGREPNMKWARPWRKGISTPASSLLKTYINPDLVKFVGMVQEIIAYQQAGVRAKYKEIVSDNKRVRITLLVFGLVSLALCVVTTMVITRSITHPIQKSIDVAKTLADGNLAVDVTVDRKDEFGDQLDAFRVLVEKWKALISEVKSSATSVASASHELSASAEQLARGATSQVERTVQVSTASEEMSQASLDIARNVNSISDSAKEMVLPPRTAAASSTSR
jgi:methyl-accepting chemotaxis protein